MALKVNGVTVVDDNKAATLLSVEALGSATKLAAKLPNLREKISYLSSPSGVLTIDLTTASVWRTSVAAGNWSILVRGSSTATLDSLIGLGETVSFSVMVPVGSTPYYSYQVSVDTGTPAGIYWAGAVPTAGYPNSLNVYSYVVEKASNGVFQVYASLSKFAG